MRRSAMPKPQHRRMPRRSRTSSPSRAGSILIRPMHYQAGSLNAHGGQGGPTALSQQQFLYRHQRSPRIKSDGRRVHVEHLQSLYRVVRCRGALGSDRAIPAIRRPEANWCSTPSRSPSPASPVSTTRPDCPAIPGFCGTCHDGPNVGDHSVKAPLNIGVTVAVPPPPDLDISGLPRVFTLNCVSRPAGRSSFLGDGPRTCPDQWEVRRYRQAERSRSCVASPPARPISTTVRPRP